MLDFNYAKTEDGNYIWKYDGTFPEFNAREITDKLTEWIRDFFAETGGKIAVVGISGGKDSSVVAALCARALGAENVIGVKMSDGGQDDWADQRLLIEHLGIHSLDFDIGEITQAFRDTASDIGIATPGWEMADNTVPENMWDIPERNRELAIEADKADDFGILANDYELPSQAAINMPARVRMTTLYMIAQSLNESARVMNTCNLSEDFVGWSSRWGDSVGDAAPLANLTASEVCLLGLYLGLPEHLIFKAPADGLTAKTDEDNFGFTYADLDTYIRIGDHASIPDDVKTKIDEMHVRNEFKMHMPPIFPSGIPVLAGRGGSSKAEETCTCDCDEETPDWLRKLKSAPTKEFPKKSLEDSGMDVTFWENVDRRDFMVPCPNCHTTEHLHIKSDLVSLNALEYWIECYKCREHWTDRMLGVDYAKTEEELIELWNKNFGEQVAPDA